MTTLSRKQTYIRSLYSKALLIWFHIQIINKAHIQPTTHHIHFTHSYGWLVVSGKIIWKSGWCGRGGANNNTRIERTAQQQQLTPNETVLFISFLSHRVLNGSPFEAFHCSLNEKSSSLSCPVVAPSPTPPFAVWWTAAEVYIVCGVDLSSLIALTRSCWEKLRSQCRSAVQKDTQSHLKA